MIVNFKVTQVESKTYVTPEEVKKQKSININYDISLKNTTIIPKQTPFGEKTVLRVEYAFSINYLSPNVGHIRFEGYSDYYSDEEDLTRIKSEWDGGKAPPEVQNQIANTMVSNLAPLAVTLSSTLGLPPAMPLPNINFQQQQKKAEPVQTTYHG
ncbi:MAG: hypothetical protein EF813_00780 [Methanosarcinales archaeon]|nr:MAG: hypothetical protein EF813_00780 [Methanosarcinales archaeon]